MKRRIRKLSRTAGLAPGALVHVGNERFEKPRITVIDYSEDRVDEKTLSSVDECFPYRDTPGVTWINIDGVHDTEIVQKIGSHFGIHPLILEDVVNTSQRPKYEDFGSNVFVVTKMIYYEENTKDLIIEQVSLVIGAGYVISFQERTGDVFSMVRDRIRTPGARHRKLGSDYLAYSLIDAVVDHYFVILEDFGGEIEELEEKVAATGSPETLRAIHRLKQAMIFLRKASWPMREAIGNLSRGESPLIHEQTRLYLRDVYDHTMQVIDTIETYREMISGMLDIYLSSVSNRLNQVMKVLTVIATIFIPLTLITGIYGMNFRYMPELQWRYGYPAVLLLMLTIGGGMAVYFKRKNWF